LNCVLDTDVLIAILDDRDSHHRQADALITALHKRAEGALLSLVNYAEALVKPAEDEATLLTAHDAVVALVELVVPNDAIARDAARFRALGVSLADGFAMATARARGAALASFDRRVRRAAVDAGVELHAMIAV